MSRAGRGTLKHEGRSVCCLQKLTAFRIARIATFGDEEGEGGSAWCGTSGSESVSGIVCPRARSRVPRLSLDFSQTECQWSLIVSAAQNILSIFKWLLMGLLYLIVMPVP